MNIERKNEPIDTKPLPAKLATFFRLCDEARKRCAKMYYVGNKSSKDKYDRQDRWAEAYYHKKRQVEVVGRNICGSKAYYDVVVLQAIYYDTSYHIRVIDAALDAARQAIIELNFDM